ncbi:response regulator [Sporocytophaga myxococcoides]|nr:response regulator [Sporocytophaga myxococcoides]
MAAKSILLLEDDELDLYSFERAIQKFNLPIDFHSVHNGVEALELLNGVNKIPIPDIIVIDLNLPKMDGFEFLEEIRKDRRFDLVRIFVMTTSNEEKNRIRAESFKIDGYTIKPLNFNENTKRNSSMDNFMHFQILKMIGKTFM